MLGDDASLNGDPQSSRPLVPRIHRAPPKGKPDGPVLTQGSRVRAPPTHQMSTSRGGHWPGAFHPVPSQVTRTPSIETHPPAQPGRFGPTNRRGDRSQPKQMTHFWLGPHTHRLARSKVRWGPRRKTRRNQTDSGWVLGCGPAWPGLPLWHTPWFPEAKRKCRVHPNTARDTGRVTVGVSLRGRSRDLYTGR